MATPLADTTWAGPTEADVLAGVTEFTPTHVTWDEYTVGEAYSTLSLAVVSTGAPVVVERSLDGLDSLDDLCRAGPELEIPVVLDLDVGNGDAVGQVEGTLAATQDGTVVYLDVVDDVALSESWESAALASYADRNPGATVSEWQVAVVQQPWGPDVRIGIEGHGDPSSSLMWGGHWSEAAP